MKRIRGRGFTLLFGGILTTDGWIQKRLGEKEVRSVYYSKQILKTAYLLYHDTHLGMALLAKEHSPLLAYWVRCGLISKKHRSKIPQDSAQFDTIDLFSNSHFQTLLITLKRQIKVKYSLNHSQYLYVHEPTLSHASQLMASQRS